MNTYKSCVEKDHVVLEIGASSSKRTRELARYCNRLIGVEAQADRIPDDYANINYIHGDWQTLTHIVEPASIDLAVASHVIEHVPDDSLAIEQLYSVLKPSGKAILNTPNRKRLTRRVIEFFTGERIFPWWEHVREYTLPDLKELLGSSPFDDFEIKPIVFGLHGDPLFIYLERVPSMFINMANFWEIRLNKE